MEDNILTRELLKRIFGNLGAVPGKNFGMVGITTPEFNTGKTITLEDDDGGHIASYPIFTGQALVQGSYKVALVNTGTISVPEFILILVPEGLAPIGFRLIWDGEDCGAIAQKHDEGWLPISLVYKMNLATAFEMMTQEGVTWQPCKEFKPLVEDLMSILDA